MLRAAVTALALFCAPLAHAQSRLPPEAQARILIVQAQNAFDRGDEAGALAALGELTARNLPRPPTTLVLEARLAGRAKDYPRVRRVLEAYFKAAKPDDAQYDEAAQLYAAVDELERQESARQAAAAKAADEAAWTRANTARTCESYTAYLMQAKAPAAFGAQAMQGLMSLSCTVPPAVSFPASVRAPIIAGAAALPPYTMFRDCAECPDMVVMPAGSFVIGSPANEAGRESNEGPQKTITIAPFAIGRFEVTFDEWAACAKDGGCGATPNPNDQGWGRGGRPVINVSWNDAKEYVAWISRKSGQTYRLLSEAEWEYAARAGTPTRFVWGNEDPICDIQSTRGANFSGCGYGQTRPVGTFRANPWGVYDLHGNVWEWVEDCYETSYAATPANGVAMTSGSCSQRVLRGGSWYIDPQILRSASRSRSNPTLRFIYVGFRLARTL